MSFSYRRYGVMQRRSRIAAAITQIAEHFAARAEALVAGEDHWTALVGVADLLEESVCADAVDQQVAVLADDEQPRPGKELELLVEPAFSEGLGQGGGRGAVCPT